MGIGLGLGIANFPYFNPNTESPKYRSPISLAMQQSPCLETPAGIFGGLGLHPQGDVLALFPQQCPFV